MYSFADTGFSSNSRATDTSVAVSDEGKSLLHLLKRAELACRELEIKADLFDAIDDVITIFETRKKPNWDSYQAQPIKSVATREAAFFLLKMPDVASIPEVMPLPSGGIGFEWRNSGNDILTVS